MKDWQGFGFLQIVAKRPSSQTQQHKEQLRNVGSSREILREGWKAGRIRPGIPETRERRCDRPAADVEVITIETSTT